MKRVFQAIAAFVVAFVFVASFLYCAPLAIAELFIGAITVVLYERFRGNTN